MPQADFSQSDFERCALCAGSSDLQVSHVIPGFVFDWLRKTSATGQFRFSRTPNRRIQDGLKLRMLCRDCEQLFSSWEKKFVEQCFVPLNKGCVHNISYGPWMLKFATSVSWRVLRVFAASGYLAGLPDHIQKNFSAALQEWSQFLLGDNPDPGPHEQHMFMVDVVASTSIANTPPNISRYLARAIDTHVAYYQDSTITYAKMGRFILFGFVAVKYPRRWQGTKLHVRHGRFDQHDIELPSDVGDLLFERARLTAEHYSQISERQRSKIRQSYEQEPERADQSETFRAMHHDVLMFGRSAFEVTQPDVYGCVKKNNG